MTASQEPFQQRCPLQHGEARGSQGHSSWAESRWRCQALPDRRGTPSQPPMSTPSEPEATQTGSQPGTTQGVVTRLSPTTLLGNSEDHQPLHPAHPTVTPHTPAVPLGGEHRYQHPAQLAPSSAGSQGTDRPHPTCLTPIWLSPRPAPCQEAQNPHVGKQATKKPRNHHAHAENCQEVSGRSQWAAGPPQATPPGQGGVGS